MKPLSVGERCAVYDNGKRMVGVVGQVGDSAGSKNIRVDSTRSQQCDFIMLGWFHHKQCRRIKPKAKRRRVWLNTEWVDGNYVGAEIVISQNPLPNMAEFVEVRRAK